MNLLLTSCGLETSRIKDAFLSMLPKTPAQTHALFIPTAANDPDAIEVLPKCLEDLLKCGIPKKQILVYDLHDVLEETVCGTYDVIYLCGGSTAYLLRRIREQNFQDTLFCFLKRGGVVVGVSAGSVIFASNLSGNLGMLHGPLSVHAPDNLKELPGRYPADRTEGIRLGNQQAIIWEGEELVIIE